MEMGEVCLQQSLVDQLMQGPTPTEVQFISKANEDIIPLGISNTTNHEGAGDFLCPECGTVVIPFRPQAP